MSLTKLPLGRNNSVMTSLFPPRESLVVTSRLGTGNSRSFFYGVVVQLPPLLVQRCNGTTAGLGYLEVNVICPHCSEDPIYVFHFWELRDLSPKYRIRVSVSDKYIPMIGPHISCNRIGRSIVVIYKSFTDT